MKKISIIIPCYNAADCIDRCIKSLVNQTIGIEHLELIFVNDASTDTTLEVLSEWEQQYPDSILVVDCAENGKQGTARNIGFTYASSEYIGFMDNDDIAEPDMFEKLYYKAVEYNCDLVVCHAKKHTAAQLKDNSIQMGPSSREDRYINLISDSDRASFLALDINRAIWNKLYKKSVIAENNIRFPEGYIYDDICFSELVKHYVKNVYLLEEYLYHHIISPDAASYSSKNWTNKLGYFDVQVILIQELRNRGLYKKYKETYDEQFMIDYFALIKNFLNTYHDMPPEILNAWNRQILLLFPDYKDIPLIKKLKSHNTRTFYKLICESFEQKAEQPYINMLVSALKGN